MNVAIAQDEVKSQPVTKMMSSNLTSYPLVVASSSQLAQCLIM